MRRTQDAAAAAAISYLASQKHRPGRVRLFGVP